MFVISSVITPGEAIAYAQRVEWQNRRLHSQHQLHHLRRDPAGDEAGQSFPGAVRKGGGLQKPGIETYTKPLTE